MKSIDHIVVGKKAERAALSPEELDQRAEREDAERPEQLARLRAQVQEAFPGSGEAAEKMRMLIDGIMDVPQWGNYHNEGLFLSAHLERILQTAEQIGTGEMTPEVQELFSSLDPRVQAMVRRAVKADFDRIRRYTFLHDLEKKSAVTLNKIGEKKGKKPASEGEAPDQWAAYESTYGGLSAIALRKKMQEEGIESIGYPDHGEDGVDLLKRSFAEEELRALGVDELIQMGIALHELGFQKDVAFSTVLEKYPVLRTMTPDMRDFVAAVNVLDQAGSMGKAGVSDVETAGKLSAFLANAAVFHEVEQRLATERLEGVDVEQVKKSVIALKDGKEDEARMKKKDDPAFDVFGISANRRWLRDADTEWQQILERNRLVVYQTDRLAEQLGQHPILGAGELGNALRDLVRTPPADKQLASAMDAILGRMTTDKKAIPALKKDLATLLDGNRI